MKGSQRYVAVRLASCQWGHILVALDNSRAQSNCHSPFDLGCSKYRASARRASAWPGHGGGRCLCAEEDDACALRLEEQSC